MTNDECRNFLIPDTHFQHIRATMGVCKWAAPLSSYLVKALNSIPIKKNGMAKIMQTTMEASAHLKMNPIILSMLISKSTTVTLTGAGMGCVFAVGAAGILICVRLAFASASLIAFCSNSLRDAQRSVCSGGDKF
jgi:hypothetical protein